MASEKDKRIELLEAQRRDDVATNRGLVARIAELEQKLANLRALVHEEQTTNNIILGQVARADRLAELAKEASEMLDQVNLGRAHDLSDSIDEALAAYLNGGDRPPGDSPDERPGCGAAGGGDW